MCGEERVVKQTSWYCRCSRRAALDMVMVMREMVKISEWWRLREWNKEVTLANLITKSIIPETFKSMWYFSEALTGRKSSMWVCVRNPNRKRWIRTFPIEYTENTKWKCKEHIPCGYFSPVPVRSSICLFHLSPSYFLLSFLPLSFHLPLLHFNRSSSPSLRFLLPSLLPLLRPRAKRRREEPGKKPRPTRQKGNEGKLEAKRRQRSPHAGSGGNDL